MCPGYFLGDEAAARDFKTIQHSHPSLTSCAGFVNGRTLRGRGHKQKKEERKRSQQGKKIYEKLKKIINKTKQQ